MLAGLSIKRVRIRKGKCLEHRYTDNRNDCPLSRFGLSDMSDKWNKIEHRLFSQITKNWRGRPLISLEVIVNLIAATSTEQGLRVLCNADTRLYETGIKVSDEELAGVNLYSDPFHPEWNYTIEPTEM